MGLFERVFGNGSFDVSHNGGWTRADNSSRDKNSNGAPAGPSQPRQSQDSNRSTQTAVLNGPVRVWTPRMAAGIVKTIDEHGNVGETDWSYRYPLKLSGGSAGVGEVTIDAHLGYFDKDERMPRNVRLSDIPKAFHAWDSTEPGVPISVDQMESSLKRNLHYHFGDKCTGEWVPALKQYFDEKGNFIGKDRNMKFQIEGYTDQLTEWLFAEMENG